MPLEPAKCVQSHSSCSGGWSGANSIYCYLLNFYSKNFSPSIYTTSRKPVCIPKNTVIKYQPHYSFAASTFQISRWNDVVSADFKIACAARICICFIGEIERFSCCIHSAYFRLSINCNP